MLYETGITKNYYLDFMEWTVEAYTKEELEAELPEKGGLLKDIHWYSRAANVIGFLISKGRLLDYKSLWINMMDALAEDFPQREDYSAADFAVKEFSICLMETKHLVEPSIYERWLNKLAEIDPYKLYHVNVKRLGPYHFCNNINIYNMLGEFLRERLGAGSCADYINMHMPSQLDNFTPDGMYKDPNCPLLYDLTTRVQLQGILHYGYQGEYKNRIDALLKKGGLSTLMMQTANGELTFGGRSNQFIFNDVLLAACLEYEASRCKKEGNLQMAGKFKRGARKAILSTKPWLSKTTKKHVKNLFNKDCMHGCEDYAYYAKYLITAGCFAIFAYIFADDTIQEYICPAESGSHIFITEKEFHKVFAFYNGQSIVIDTDADTRYDAVGIGSYHIDGIHSPFILSSPFCKGIQSYENHFGVPKRAMSISSGFVKNDGVAVYLTELHILKCTVNIVECNERSVSLRAEWFFEAIDGVSSINEFYRLDNNGLMISSSITDKAKVCFQIPYFVSDGKHNANLQVNETRAVNQIDSCRIAYESTALFINNADPIANRNGVYGLLETFAEYNIINICIRRIPAVI